VKLKSPFIASSIGKVVARVSRLKGGHGSALPGLVVERLAPDFLHDVLGKLSRGVVVVSGTNGKTTTTKMTVELLRAAGLKVFTNPSGSNFTRGVASSAILEMKRGKLDADIAVVELDEAHAVHFVNKIAPKCALLLNVMRDQLDRFGEIDTTAGFLQKVATKTTDTVILNREDPRIAAISAKKTVFFGYSAGVSSSFPNDDELYGLKSVKSTIPASVILEKINGDNVTFNIGKTKLELKGAHNAFNAAGALALTKEILNSPSPSHSLRGSGIDSVRSERFARNKSEDDTMCEAEDDNLSFNAKKMLKALSEIKPAFGRGESFNINGASLELILVKNPSGFRIVLGSQYNPNAQTMICINDQYADGRDMSWLWDVDLSMIKRVAMVSGVRGYDMALRLACQNIEFGRVETDLDVALADFLNQNPDKPKQIFTTYTAMLHMRKILKKEYMK
jgi:UDP-N-acetylmuramyl tripeptide synthase